MPDEPTDADISRLLSGLDCIMVAVKTTSAPEFIGFCWRYKLYATASYYSAMGKNVYKLSETDEGQMIWMSV